METVIKDINNVQKDTIELSESFFGLEIRKDILHTAVLNYLANQRQGTHATKNRSLVRGGGKKPWRQKHTGRSRQGTNRSPLWKGGGTVFGPQPRDYSYKLNKKFKRVALKTALSTKYSEGKIIFLDIISMENPKTKDMVKILENLGLKEKKVLIVLPNVDENIILSSRNIKGVNVLRAVDINTYQIMFHDTIIITKDALSVITGSENEKSLLNN